MSSKSNFSLTFNAFYSLGHRHFVKRKILAIQAREDGQKRGGFRKYWIYHCKDILQLSRQFIFLGWGGDRCRDRLVIINVKQAEVQIWCEMVKSENCRQIK